MVIPLQKALLFQETVYRFQENVSLKVKTEYFLCEKLFKNFRKITIYFSQRLTPIFIKLYYLSIVNSFT